MNKEVLGNLVKGVFQIELKKRNASFENANKSKLRSKSFNEINIKTITAVAKER